MAPAAQPQDPPQGSHKVTVSSATLAHLCKFSQQQLALNLGTAAHVAANFEDTLALVLRATSVKLNALARVLASVEARLAARSLAESEYTEAVATLASEREANAILTAQCEFLLEEKQLLAKQLSLG